MRFFFDTQDGEIESRDEEGLELPDADAARRLALSSLPDMADDALPNGDHQKFSVVVRTEDGALVYRADLTLRGRWMNRS
jgi:hypothetical protein